MYHATTMCFIQRVSDLGTLFQYLLERLRPFFQSLR